MDMAGKVVLLTGGTDGIGKAAALAFARRGATLVLLARDAAKAERVLAELAAGSGNADLHAIPADLGRLADVRHAAEAFALRFDRLDVLANNAGAMFRAPARGPEGYERTFALNHLAPFLLTTSLLDLLRATPGARVVTTASAVHTQSRGELVARATSLAGSGVRAYADAKLANVLFTAALQRRLAGSTAIATCFHPGTVRTRFGGYGADLGPLLGLGFWLAGLVARTPEQGADTLVWLATAPEAAGLGGAYVVDRRVRRPSRVARDAELAEALWEASERLCAEAAGG